MNEAVDAKHMDQDISEVNQKTPFFVENNCLQGAIGVLRDHLEALADASTYKEVQADSEIYISVLREGEEQFHDIYVEEISQLIVPTGQSAY